MRLLTETEDRLLQTVIHVTGNVAEDLQTLIHRIEAGGVTNREIIATLEHIQTELKSRHGEFLDPEDWLVETID
ncbi:MAG: hypothetical protein ACRC29_13915 [Enterobacterales bacterium]